MLKVFREVVECDEQWNSIYWTASPDEIDQLIQWQIGSGKKIVWVASDAISDKVRRVLAHCEEYLHGIPWKIPQPQQMQGNNGDTQQQMH